MILLPDPPDEYSKKYMRELLQAIERYLPQQQVSRGRKYNIKNFTQTFTLDLDKASQDDVNNFLATLANDIYSRGLLP